MAVSMIISEEVQKALTAGMPVVALESTIISHGMPYPDNLTTAVAVEEEVRSGGCVPATVAIIGGVPHIGLSRPDLEKLAVAGPSVHKASVRDLPCVLTQGRTASTTVAATAHLAHEAGIKVFVTGGIGGVHRGAEQTWDVSADLVALGKTPICVVCAGAKAILDLPRTLEYLETQGVPVIGYGTDDFPGFYVAKTGLKVPLRLDTPDECALALANSRRLNLKAALLVTVPVPEIHAMKSEAIQAAIDKALTDASAEGIRGKDITPRVLQRIGEITGDIALVKNNAKVGAAIALSLSRLVTY